MDSTYLDRGVKKFYEKENQYKNIAEVIKEKSAAEKTPRMSAYRKAEYARTR